MSTDANGKPQGNSKRQKRTRRSYQRHRIPIPTYVPETGENDWTRPHDLTMDYDNGLRVVMGEWNDADAPDIKIEREPGKWRIFVHPNSGDPLCIIEITETTGTVMADLPEITEPLLVYNFQKQERVRG